MEDSNSSKPVMVTSSLNFKVTTPSFYNQPKKFASVAPPRPKSQTPPSAPSPTPVGTGVIGRVGDLPPPPPLLCDDFPPPPPPPLDDDLPAPPPECHTSPTASEVPPPTFPAPPPVADDMPLPAPPEESACPPTCPSPPPPPPPPPLPASSTSIPSAAGNPQRLIEKQTSFDQQLDSLTDLLSEMETRGPFNPKLPSQYSSAPAPKPLAPPPTAPKPALSFLPPPEMGDRPPPAPWAEELKARTNRQANHNSAPNSAAQPFTKAPALPPPPPTQPNNAAAAPASNHIKSSPFAGHVNANQNPPAAVPPPQPKVMASPPSSFNQPMKTPPASTPSPPAPVPIPGGGVPLNMREVEELERMTKDFIKDMDTHAPVITSPPTEVCGKCGEALSRTQPAVRAMDKLFHSNCFCCMSCHRPLQGMQFYDRDGSPQCEDCYMSSLAVCSRCGERITDRVLKAVGQCFHAHCFRCSTCSCILEGAPFITDDNNNPYCVQDYHRRFSPLCVSCNEPIVPAPGSEETVRVVALDKNFHLKCYRCEDCARPLSIEADENGCYPLDGRILCMKCHTQRAKRAVQ
ncbi:zyxin [Lates japonicus]|uniref:Zyxin n=1 Tax=Lates japonicus TaxID=270547 RepID=A0AAD3N1X3_LATJO|nr:zyxin [Lates japonicus]